MHEDDDERLRARLMRGAMPTTDWKVFVEVGHDSAEGRAAVARICETYAHPIHHFIRRRFGAAQAEDLTQGFLTHLVETDALARVEPEVSRFRNWLERAIVNHVRDAHRHATRQKRGSGAAHLTFDAAEADRLYAAEVRDDMSPEQALDAGLVAQLLRDARRRLEAAFVADHGQAKWDALAPLIEGVDHGELAPIAAQFGTTPRRVSGTLTTLRKVLLAYCVAELRALGSQDPEGELRALAGL